MSAAIARRWFEEVWNKRNVAVIDEIADHNTVAHHEWGDTKGIESFRSMHAEFLAAMPDLKFTVEDTLEDGSGRVAVRWLLSGRHSGKGMGCPATNNHVRVRGITWMVFKNGRIIEGWDTFNFDGLVGTLSGKGRT